MHIASASPSTPRAAAGRARRPRAGTSTTVGVTRAHASPSAPRSTPASRKPTATSCKMPGTRGMYHAMAFDMSIVGKPSDVSRFSYSWKDAVLYALGIGAKKDELDFLYEGASFGNVDRKTEAPRPKVIPSFAVVPTFPVMVTHLAQTGGDLAMVVHGAQKFRVHKPFAPSGELVSTAT